jgi:hypothetical protein
MIIDCHNTKNRRFWTNRAHCFNISVAGFSRHQDHRRVATNHAECPPANIIQRSVPSMDDNTAQTSAVYKRAHRLAMFNLVLWFVAGALQINGQNSLYPLYAGFAYSIFLMFYYYYHLRKQYWPK